MTSGLSQVAKTTDDESAMAVQASVPASNNTDEYLCLTEPVLDNEKFKEPSPEFDSYKEDFYTSSPVNQLNESTDIAIEKQLSSEDKFEQVVNDSLLDRLQEQELVSEEIVAALSRDQINEKEQEIFKLKEKLEVSLSSLKEVEQELLDSQFRHEQQLKSLNISHTTELEKVHEQHRMVVDKLANEMSARPPLETEITTQSQQLDRDEIEMERLKLIKESLKENYEKEKNEMKEGVIKEYQEKMESYKKEMEEKANSLLKQYREQDFAAFNEQIKQKDEAAATLLQTLDTKEIEYHEKLSQLQQHVNKLEERFSQANEEKQLEVAALYKSHSDELYSIQLGKKELESDLKKQIEQWKSKAANLEHLLESASESVASVDAESTEQLKTDYEEKLVTALQEKSQLESQLLSKINAINEEFSKEKQQQELYVEKKNNEICKLRAELERINKTLLANETAATDASREIEKVKSQHEEALEKMQLSLAEAHQKELAAIQEDHQTVSNQLQMLSNQVAELNESKLDAVSRLEKTQHQLNNLQLSLAQSNEENQKLKDKIQNLELDLNTAESTSAQTIANFERDTSSYKTQINQLETTISEFLSRESQLQTELQALREQNITEDDKLIPVQDVLFTELDVEVLRKAEDLTSSSFTSSLELIKKLLATLESKTLEVTSLQESNRTLACQMSELQETISEDKLSTTEVDLLRAYEQLQISYEELKDSSSIELENLKHEKQRLQDIHKEELNEKEKAISSLQKQLQTVDLVSVELQNEFGREFTRYESEKQSLEQAVKEKIAAKDEFDSIVSAQAKEIEQKFEKERQALVAKLNEKETLEAELTSRKIDLEKRLTEKAKLEEVLAEKSRLEQELLVQKSELERELFEIETKLKGKENEMQQERNDWSMKLSEKDSTIQLAREKLQHQDKLFVQKEKQLKESHDQEVHKLLTDIEQNNLRTKETVDNLNTTHAERMATLQSEMDEKNFQALNEMEARLNKSHQEELGELKEKHSVEVI